MLPPMMLLRIAALSATFVALPPGGPSARACEDASAALQAPLAQPDAADEPRSGSLYAQLQRDEVALVTGDGQQGSDSTNAIACAAPNAGCTP